MVRNCLAYNNEKIICVYLACKWSCRYAEQWSNTEQKQLSYGFSPPIELNNPGVESIWGLEFWCVGFSFQIIFLLPSGYYDEIIDHFNDCAKCSIDQIFFSLLPFFSTHLFYFMCKTNNNSAYNTSVEIDWLKVNNGQVHSNVHSIYFWQRIYIFCITCSVSQSDCHCPPNKAYVQNNRYLNSERFIFWYYLLYRRLLIFIKNDSVIWLYVICLV